ncbi:unnamed protein product, partial [Ectocarpus sp. 12 AP-2014]
LVARGVHAVLSYVTTLSLVFSFCFCLPCVGWRSVLVCVGAVVRHYRRAWKLRQAVVVCFSLLRGAGPGFSGCLLATLLFIFRTVCTLVSDLAPAPLESPSGPVFFFYLVS